MKTLTLLPHEAAACPTLLAVWRPVKQIAMPNDSDRELIYRDGYVWCSLAPEELSPLDDAKTIYGAPAIRDGVLYYTPIVVGGGDGRFLACPYGQPGDVVVGEWIEDHECEHPWGRSGVSVRCDRRFTIASISVRRVDSMTLGDAVDWGCGCAEYPHRALEQAVNMWHARWPAAAWAWVIQFQPKE